MSTFLLSLPTTSEPTPADCFPGCELPAHLRAKVLVFWAQLSCAGGYYYARRMFF